MSAAQARRCRGAPIYSMICASSSGAAGSRPPSIPRAIMASSCASDIRSVTGVVVASISLGIKHATTARARPDRDAAVISAGWPKACQLAWTSRKNSSLSLLREPFGRPLGLPDWPGFQGINPRCLCFRTVESLPSKSCTRPGRTPAWQNKAKIWHAITRIVEHLSFVSSPSMTTIRCT